MVVYAGIIQFLITSNVSDVLHSGVLTFDVYCNVYEMLFSHCFSSGWGNYSFIMLNGLLDECSSLLFSCSSHICLQYGNFFDYSHKYTFVSGFLGYHSSSLPWEMDFCCKGSTQDNGISPATESAMNKSGLL